MALILERLVTDLVRPHRRADSVVDSRHSPQIRRSWVLAVTSEERHFETSVLLPLPDCESAEVADRGPPLEFAEIDDLDNAVIDEPVPGLPIAVGGNDDHRLRVMVKKQRPQSRRVTWLDSMRLIKPAN